MKTGHHSNHSVLSFTCVYVQDPESKGFSAYLEEVCRRAHQRGRIVQLIQGTRFSIFVTPQPIETHIKRKHDQGGNITTYV
jgi:hypothetical protein